MQVINTKLSIPPLRAKLVERSGLIQKLNQGIACGFVLISAPAGYGKSTLLSAWLGQVNFSCAWLSLDAGDNDLARFLTYLAATLQMVDPTIKKVFDVGADFSGQPDAELLLTPLINHFTQSDRPICLILDDYHVIQNQAVHQFISFLLEHRPALLSLVIATRADPPLPLSRLRARSAVLELRQSDLCFTIQESAEFLNHTMELHISSDDIKHLTARTEGWIAGLQMAGLSLQGKTEISDYIRSFNGENRYILNFLFDEVIHHQNNDIQNFLLQTSLLERLCNPLCDAVTQRNDSQVLLETLESSNLFLIALDEEKEWYRYHTLFAELLRSRLAQLAPQSVTLLHQRASDWFAEQNDLENAIAHALAAPEYERAANLIEQVLQKMDLINRQPLIASWIDQLPQEIHSGHPWLCAYRAYGDYWTGNRERAEEWVQKAESSSDKTFEEGSLELLRIQGFIAAVRAHTALAQENIPFALEMAHKALGLLPEGDMMHATTGLALGAAYWAAGDVILSEQAFSKAQTTALKTSNANAVAPSCYLGIQQIKRGHLQTAMATFRQGLRLSTQADGHEAAIAGFPNIKLGDVLRQRNELELASQHLRKGVEQCLRLTQVDFLTDAYVCFGRYQLAAGDLEASYGSIQRADQLAQQAKIDQWVVCWLNDLRLKYWLATGNLQAAILWAKDSGLTIDGPLNYLHDLHHQNLARVLVAQSSQEHSRGAYEPAANLLARLLEATKKAGWVHEEIIIRILQALNEQAYYQNEAALQSLARAVSMAQPGGYVRVFLDEGEVMRTLLLGLFDQLKSGKGLIFLQEQQNSMHAYIAMLLSSFNPSTKLTSEPPLGIFRSNQSLIEPLSSRELEILQLLSKGYSDKKISETLYIAAGTVHKHLKNIYGKLQVHSRSEAIAYARELNLL